MYQNFKIETLKSSTIPEIKNFIIKNHYSKSLSRGNKYVFVLKVNNRIKGVATFGTPVGRNSPGDLECKRFCLAPKAKKNTASWFMAKCIKEIKKFNEFKTVISYADPEQGHTGTMYRASNFKYLGEQNKKGQALMFKGEKIHLRAAYQKVNGEYTKTARTVMKALKQGKAKTISLAKKHIFAYNLK